MDDDHRHRSLASAVRRLTEALARASSADGPVHHRSFVEQLEHLDPATSATAELRALTQHARMAVVQSQPSPVPIVLAVALVCVGQFLGFVAPARSMPHVTPARVVMGEVCHFVGFIAMAVSVVLAKGRTQHGFIALGLSATGIAQICIVTARYAGTDNFVSTAIAIAMVGEVVGLVALCLVVTGLTGRRRTFAAGWRCFALSIGVLCLSQVAWAVAFARHGDTYWVVAISLTVFGGALLTRYLYRYVPFSWLASRPGVVHGE